MGWVLPHQFVPRTVQNMGPTKPGAMSVSLIKGGLELEGGKLGLCSDVLRKLLQHNMGVLMGANVANEVAQGQFCEATLGSDAPEDAQALLVKLFNCQDFRVRAVDDIAGVELCGALKNIVALGAGFCDGLDFGRNRKCAEAFVRGKGVRSWEEIEKELLGGQKLQGTLTAQEIWPVMKEHKLCERLPLLTTIYEIAFESKNPRSIVALTPAKRD